MAAQLQKTFECMNCHEPIKLQRKDDNSGWLRYELDGLTSHRCSSSSSSNYDIVDDSSSDSNSGISSRSACDIVGESSSSDSTNDYASGFVSAVSPVSLSDSSENFDERLNGKEKDEANDTDNDNDDKVQKGHPDSKS